MSREILSIVKCHPHKFYGHSALTPLETFPVMTLMLTTKLKKLTSWVV